MKKILKVLFIVLSILLIIPSCIYLIQNKSVMEFDTYYNFFINNNIDKILSTSIYLILFILISLAYLFLIKKDAFSDIKSLLKYVTAIGIIFAVMLPWTSSDVFYYMGVGELDSRYNQNPYYVTMRDYYTQNEDNIDDEILEKGANGYWGNTTVVYGPISQLIFKVSSFVSMKNVTLGLFIYKLINLIVHIANCYLIYRITGKKRIFASIYGLNPFILIECIANVHNDVIVIFFLILSIYFLLKKKNLALSIVFLALATGIKYFSILLLPIIILYYYRNEKSLAKRFLRCVEFGIMFLIIFALEYALYFKDYHVITAMFAQTGKYAKSIYSIILQFNQNWLDAIKALFIIAFIMYYFVLCINLLTNKDIRFYKTIRSYNIALILFLLILTSFQQWYLVWLFATFMWQKANTIRNIVGLGLCTEIANSAYIFLYESYKFDKYFIGAIIVLFLIWKILTNKEKKKGVEV